MRYLEPFEVKRLNKLLISATGGSSGSINEANLHFVCDQAKTLGKNLPKIAAHYLYWFAFKAHVFTDGNKRTSLNAMITFLEFNEYALKTNNEELVGLALTTAKGEMTLKELEPWIKARLIKIADSAI